MVGKVVGMLINRTEFGHFRVLYIITRILPMSLMFTDSIVFYLPCSRLKQRL